MRSATLRAQCKMGEVIQLQQYPTQQKDLLIFGQYRTKSGHSVVVQQSWENALCAECKTAEAATTQFCAYTRQQCSTYSFLPRKSKSYFRLLLHTYFYLGWVKKNLDMGLKVRFSFEKSFLVQSKFISKDKIILISQFYLNQNLDKIEKKLCFIYFSNFVFVLPIKYKIIVKSRILQKNCNIFGTPCGP